MSESPESKMEKGVRKISTDRLSHFRTHHEFIHYGEFSSTEEFVEYFEWSKKNRIPLVILGAGSNVLFRHRRIRSLVLKNSLPKILTEINPSTLQVSSSTMIAQVLKWCQDRNLDSCYYLASVPATVGGAIAMNAGRGKAYNRSIYDYVQSVTILRNGKVITLERKDIQISYRKTPFTGLKSDLILHVVLEFPPMESDINLRKERIQWSKEHQDHSLPNCGSVFKQSNPNLMRRLKGFKISTARYSSKTGNWLLSSGPRSWPLVWLIRLTRLLHLLIGKRSAVEIIQID